MMPSPASPRSSILHNTAARSASFLCSQMSKSDNFGEKMKEFMQKYDKNSDGKIEMAEVRAKGRGSRGGVAEESQGSY